jgi:dCMP deaminase
MNDKIIKAHMKTAYNYAECSTAIRLKVGAIIVKNDQLISIGYNGTPKGWDNNCEDIVYMPISELSENSSEELSQKWPNVDSENRRYKLVTKPEVLHAERNALDKLARTTGGGQGSTMVVTHNPCLECAKSIHSAGITRVYYSEVYRSDEGIKFLEKCGVEVTKI